MVFKLELSKGLQPFQPEAGEDEFQ